MQHANPLIPPLAHQTREPERAARRVDERRDFDACQRHSEALRVADAAFRSLALASDQGAVLKLRRVAGVAGADTRGSGHLAAAKVALTTALFPVICAALAGCTAYAPPPYQPNWYLADGRMVRSDLPAELYQRALADRASCEAERVKIIATGTTLSAYARQEAGWTVYRGCMMGKGYVQR